MYLKAVTDTQVSLSPRWQPDPDVRRGRTVVYNVHAHVVFTPKYRRRVFNKKMLARREQVMADVCADCGATLEEFNGEADHVHLLVTYPPQVTRSVLVGSLKGVSARYLRAEFGPQLRRNLWGDHLWSPSYFVGSVGGAPLSVVKEYIRNQRAPTT